MVITTTAEYREQAYQIAKPIISQATIEPRERTLAKSVFGQETPRGKLATYRQTAGFKEVFRHKEFKEDLQIMANDVIRRIEKDGK